MLTDLRSTDLSSQKSYANISHVKLAKCVNPNPRFLLYRNEHELKTQGNSVAKMILKPRNRYHLCKDSVSLLLEYENLFSLQQAKNVYELGALTFAILETHVVGGENVLFAYRTEH
jgi:hypothetical protein